MKSIGIDVQRYDVPSYDYAVTLNHHRPASSQLPFEQHTLFQTQPATYAATVHHQPAANSTNSPLVAPQSFPPHHQLHMTPLPRERSCTLQTPYSRPPSTPAVSTSVVGAHIRRIPFANPIDDRRSSVDVTQSHLSNHPDDEYHYNRAGEAKYMSGPSLGPSSHPSPVKSFDFSSQYHSSMVDFQNGNQRRKAVRAQQACDGCRQKKAKCDEQRPACSSCLAQVIPCVYKDVPPPKQEKTMQTLIETVASFSQNLEMLRDEMRQGFANVGVHAHHLGEDASDEEHSSIDAKKIRVDSVLTPRQGHQFPASPAPVHDVMNGQLSIPIEHTTAAHKLLFLWPSINSFYDKNQDRNYVMRDESRRGVLRLFGRGNGHDELDRNVVATCRRSSSVSSDGSSSSTVIDGFWGTGLPLPMVSSVQTTAPRAGGLDEWGNIDTRSSTIHRLKNSYLEHVHILHPILIKRKLTSMVNRFIASHDLVLPRSASSGSLGVSSIHDGEASIRSKRKRSMTSASRVNGIESRQVARPIFERSIETALVLLILALGKICEHKEQLPCGVEEKQSHDGGSTPPRSSTGQSPPDLSSPLQQYIARSNGTTHGDRDRHSFTTASSSSSFNVSPINGHGQRDSLLNLNVIPGLAYYSQAVGTLGELHGGNELLHVQACLLAGLYMGQLVRVFESWKWINSAGTAIQVLLKQDNLAMSEEYKNSVRIAYWSCLQLESDILAELDLPHSGISRLEDTVALPDIRALDLDSQDEVIMMYYLTQIHLRRLLNRAHTALYDSGKTKIRTAGWSMLNASDLADSLEDWRSRLPPLMQWNDYDPPASEINAARMRAKYYGARYIIHRPFLHHALHKNFPPVDVMDEAIDSAVKQAQASSMNQNLVNLYRACIEAAKASTIAFDGIRGRLIVTNIFGTAHAQFGNMLVLSAVHTSEQLSYLVPATDFDWLMNRTLRFLRRWAPLSPTLRTNARILENAKRIIDITGRSADTSFSDDTVYSYTA